MNGIGALNQAAWSDEKLLELVVLSSNARKPVLDEIRAKMTKFRMAMRNVTAGEVAYTRQGRMNIQTYLRDNGATPEELDQAAMLDNEVVIRCQIATLRWGNKICNNYSYGNFFECDSSKTTCEAKKGVTPLTFCTGCYLVQYCCKTCQREDWPRHKVICGKPWSLEREMGPQKSVFYSQNRETGKKEKVVIDRGDLEEPN